MSTPRAARGRGPGAGHPWGGRTSYRNGNIVSQLLMVCPCQSTTLSTEGSPQITELDLPTPKLMHILLVRVAPKPWCLYLKQDASALGVRDLTAPSERLMWFQACVPCLGASAGCALPVFALYGILSAGVRDPPQFIITTVLCLRFSSPFVPTSCSLSLLQI